jgi:mRNA interferase RelE/StbE
MSWQIAFENEKKIFKDLDKIPAKFVAKIREEISIKLSEDPIKFGKPLKGSFYGHRRLRVGDYRMVYRIDRPKNLVIITAISHRKDIYEG